MHEQDVGILERAADQDRRMTAEQFHEAPRLLGWKYELLEGELSVTVSPNAVATMRLTLAPRAQDPRWLVRSLRPDDKPGLMRLFVLAFADSVEYHGCPRTYVRQRAVDSVKSFWEASIQPWFSAARLIEDRRKIVAAALVRHSTRGPILEPLMVRPRYQRQGLGRAIMANVVDSLMNLGTHELFSQCHLANEGSLRWHQQFGFEELPDEWVAGHRARLGRYELERRERAGALTAQERAELTNQTAYWEAEAERLRGLSEQDFQAAHPQLM